MGFRIVTPGYLQGDEDQDMVRVPNDGLGWFAQVRAEFGSSMDPDLVHSMSLKDWNDQYRPGGRFEEVGQMGFIDGKWQEVD